MRSAALDRGLDAARVLLEHRLLGRRRRRRPDAFVAERQRDQHIAGRRRQQVADVPGSARRPASKRDISIRVLSPPRGLVDDLPAARLEQRAQQPGIAVAGRTRRRCRFATDEPNTAMRWAGFGCWRLRRQHPQRTDDGEPGKSVSTASWHTYSVAGGKVQGCKVPASLVCQHR